MITVINHPAVSAALSSLRKAINLRFTRTWLGMFTHQRTPYRGHLLGSAIGCWPDSEYTALRDWARRLEISAHY